jgi:DNA-binding NarL/FixJ family response regulator
VITVVVADDHPMVRTGLRAVLDAIPDMTLIAEAATGEQALDAVTQHQPDLVVMDLHMPGIGGLEATRRIHATSPQTAVLILTMDDDDVALFGALRAGACGYMVKGAGYDEVKAVLSLAATGEAVFGPAVAARILSTLSAIPPPDTTDGTGLTDREREVLTLLATGSGTQDISRRLHLSPKTIRNHVSAILTKLHVPDRAHAIAWARAAGLHHPPDIH